MKKEFGKTPKESETRINASIFGGGECLMDSQQKNQFTMEKALKKRKLNGTTMFAIVFTLFVLILGITAGLTYSGFQSTASSSGTLTFAINGHQGTLSLTGTKVASYDSQDLTLEITLASETGYLTKELFKRIMDEFTKW